MADKVKYKKGEFTAEGTPAIIIGSAVAFVVVVSGVASVCIITKNPRIIQESLSFLYGNKALLNAA